MANVDIWLIVGTRRWARLMATELCAILPADAIIQMLGDPADLGLQRWLLDSGLGKNIRVSEAFQPCPPKATGVAIVVNSAYMHKSTVEDVLAAGYNVICEKPISFSKQETIDLIRLAETLGLQLFCTNTYLFASYLDRFREEWLSGYQFTSMQISWSDPVREIRYGEMKGYDSSVPLIYDILPHIANIVLATVGEFSPDSNSIEVKHGGSQVLIRYLYRNLDIRIDIARNASQRKRTIAFLSEGPDLVLDFSTEPGSVFLDPQKSVPLDSAWQHKPKPIYAMLCRVREFFEAGKLDARLSPTASLFGSELIDSVVDSYVAQQINLISSQEDISRLSDREYAFKEARSIASRLLPYISEDSSLRILASDMNLHKQLT